MPPPPSPSDAARLALLAGALLAALIAPDGANAFEPGVRMRCEPSADGLSFDCRAADAAPTTAPTAAPAITPEPARDTRHEPAPATPRTGLATPIRHASTGTTRELPNYLRAAPPVEADAGIDDHRPVTVSTKPRSALRPARDASTEPALAPESASSTIAEASAASTTTEPATTAPPAAPATPPTPTEPITTTIAATPPAAAEEASPPHPAAQAGDAAAFRRLPARRYTLELWRGTAIPPVAELLDALAAQPGRLYHLEFDADGRHWHSLLWSDFETLEAARAAREALPTQIPANAGFARRIGPLQAELAPRP